MAGSENEKASVLSGVAQCLLLLGRKDEGGRTARQVLALTDDFQTSLEAFGLLFDAEAEKYPKGAAETVLSFAPPGEDDRTEKPACLQNPLSERSRKRRRGSSRARELGRRF